jgi:FtsH-binding integral membrane protein
MQMRLLRLFLGFSALAWGVSAVGVFVSWQEADSLLEGLGAKPIAYDPMLDYWLRMAAGAFALVGVWYLILTIRPRKFLAAIPWFGALMLVEGLILLVHGLRLSLPPFPFCGDVSACFIAGGGILLCSRNLPEKPA